MGQDRIIFVSVLRTHAVLQRAALQWRWRTALIRQRSVFGDDCCKCVFKSRHLIILHMFFEVNVRHVTHICNWLCNDKQYLYLQQVHYIVGGAQAQHAQTSEWPSHKYKPSVRRKFCWRHFKKIFLYIYNHILKSHILTYWVYIWAVNHMWDADDDAASPVFFDN